MSIHRKDENGEWQLVDDAEDTWGKLLQADDIAVANRKDHDMDLSESAVLDNLPITDKDIADMTDEEWNAHLDEVFSAYELEQEVLESSEGAECTCDGPPDGKFNSHLRSCPVYTDDKGPCTCKAEDHGNVHYMTCPRYVKWTPACKHFMQEFALENGLFVYPSSWRDAPFWSKRKEADMPDLGVYFYSNWIDDEGGVLTSPGMVIPEIPESKVEKILLPWTDGGAPKDYGSMFAVIKHAMKAIEGGAIVEVGCLGGHGRTGTFLGMLLVSQGVKPGEAIKRVREYCDEAIETDSQCELVAFVYETVTGDTKWLSDKSARKAFNKQKGQTKKMFWSSKSKGGTTAHSAPTHEMGGEL
jgi:hypothetical protein